MNAALLRVRSAGSIVSLLGDDRLKVQRASSDVQQFVRDNKAVIVDALKQEVGEWPNIHRALMQMRQILGRLQQKEQVAKSADYMLAMLVEFDDGGAPETMTKFALYSSRVLELAVWIREIETQPVLSGKALEDVAKGIFGEQSVQVDVGAFA